MPGRWKRDEERPDVIREVRKYAELDNVRCLRAPHEHDQIGLTGPTLSAICPWPLATARPIARTATDNVRGRRRAQSGCCVTC